MQEFLWWSLAVILTFFPIWLLLLFFGITLYKSRISPAVKQAAQQGDAKAQRLVGDRYHHGKYNLRSYKKAIKWYRLAAEQGDAKAQLSLGSCYKCGIGAQKDLKEAVKWYRLAAEQGDAKGECHLGACYSSGEGVPQDDMESLKWYRLAAERGDAAAQYALGHKYLKGDGVPQNLKESLKWFRLVETNENSVFKLPAERILKVINEGLCAARQAKEKRIENERQLKKEAARQAEEKRIENERRRTQQQEEEQRKRERQTQSSNQGNEWHYASILNLQHPITMKAVRRNYKDLTKKYHPDKVHGLGSKIRDVAENEMKAINEAYTYFEKIHEKGGVNEF